MYKKAITLEEIFDYDYKTQLAKKYPNIPKGTEVIYCGEITNFYGNYVRVEYNGNSYYTLAENVKILKE